MAENNPFRVPKETVHVRVCLWGKDPQEVTVFVAQFDGAAERDQAVLDLLEQERRFVPVLDGVGEHWSLINSDRLLWMAIPTVADEPNGGIQLFDKQSSLKLDFIDGSQLDGELLFSPPTSHGRVVDHLNRPGRYFRLYGTAEVILIRKSAVIAVRETKATGQRETGE